MLSGCLETPPNQYCGCNDYTYIGLIKNFNTDVDHGLFSNHYSCNVMLDNVDNLFIENEICKDLKVGYFLYKSSNRKGFYAVCDPVKSYPQKDKCEYEIEDIPKIITNK